MKKDNIIPLENPEENTDLLTSLLRSGARELIAKAVHIELTPSQPQASPQSIMVTYSNL